MHANAKLTPLTRAQMALAHHQLSLSLRTTATAYGVCERTVRRWLARAKAQNFPLRLDDRSSTPHRQSRKISSQLEAQILVLRRQRRSYAQIMMVLPVSKATLSRVLRRAHLNRLSSLEPPKPPVIRYERDHPGELLHLDIKKLGRFARPGVRATGDRTVRNPGAGVESLHVAIDDHSRLAFACLLPDEKVPSVLIALDQAVRFYHAHGIKIQRLLTDRGSTYRSRLFAASCHELGLKHSFTKPYRPQTNGKAERFIQTITREWAYARPYKSSNHRATFLPHYLHDYNFHRPHSALNSLPPSSRLPKTADNVSRYNS
ncbi:MAG: IS481 family transposase [Chthoniobacterales bacterium]|nr:IS481 family transposase [Chthoniobacterales bacterium]